MNAPKTLPALGQLPHNPMALPKNSLLNQFETKLKQQGYAAL